MADKNIKFISFQKQGCLYSRRFLISNKYGILDTYIE